MSRAIDDPAKLARAARIMRDALKREEEAAARLEAHVREVVAAAPPLTGAQQSQLRMIFSAREVPSYDNDTT